LTLYNSSRIRSGFFLVFIPACGEFVIPELMGGEKSMFMGNVISHYALNAETAPMGAAAFTIIMLVVVLSASYFSYRVVKKIFLGYPR